MMYDTAADTRLRIRSKPAMPDMPEFREVQRRKRRHIALVLGGMVVAIVCTVLRCVPALDDALSGQPAYMDAFANAMARNVAEMLHREYPIIVTRDEHPDCQSVTQERTDNSDDAVYVLTFSEQSRSLCLTVYGILPAGFNSGSAVTLAPAIGRNYGRSFTAPVKAVALHRNLTTLTPAYLHLLHWRTKFDPSENVRVGRTERFSSQAANISFADLSLNLLDLRAEVAKTHSTINRILLVLICLAVLVVFGSAASIRLLYGRCARYCNTQEYVLRPRDFLTRDVAAIAESARLNYLQRQQQMYAQMRADDILRRTKDEMRQRLELLLNTTGDDSTREDIRQCLERDDSQQIEALLSRLVAQSVQKTPEERLDLLMESFREYCTDDEFVCCQAEVRSVFKRAGFREARDVVVTMHDQFRARARELEARQEEGGINRSS